MAELIPSELMQWWGGTESTFGAGGASNPAGADAFDHISADAGPLPGRSIIANAEKTGYRSSKSGFQGWYDPRTFRFTCYLRGSGTNTTATDWAFLLKAAGFTETVGGSSVAYARTLDPTASNVSAWFWGATSGGEVGRSLGGCIVSQVSITAENEARIEFTGEAAETSIVHKTTLGANVTAGASTLTLATGHGWVVDSGSAPVYVKINSEVFKVTAVSGVTATLSGTAAGNHTSGDAVLAYVPARTVATTSPISSVLFAFDLNAGAEDLQFEKLSVAIKSGGRLIDKEAGELFRTGYVFERPGADAVRYTVDAHFTVGSSSIAKLAGYFAAKTSKSVLATIGTAAGNIFELASTDAEIIEAPSAPEIDNGPVKGTFIFQGHSATGADVAFTTK